MRSRSIKTCAQRSAIFWSRINYERSLLWIGLFFTLLATPSYSTVPDKVLICGICKNIEKSCFNSIQSATKLGEQFLDYRIVFYENNSTDSTKHLLQAWSLKNPRFLLLSEDLSEEMMIRQHYLGLYGRCEAIARARNRILDLILQDSYSDYKYVVWADLDLLEPWGITHIIETITHPEQDWDAVFANGSYDLFAFRDPEFPIGFELIGHRYWQRIEEIRSRFWLNPKGGWRRVYSAFGGLGIYKREAILGCRYGTAITPELEHYVLSWLSAPSLSPDTPLLKYYQTLLSTAPRVHLHHSPFYYRHLYPEDTGVQLTHPQIIWFSCVPGTPCPFTCEHIVFHAAMAMKGHDRLFVNPKLISNHPEE